MNEENQIHRIKSNGIQIKFPTKAVGDLLMSNPTPVGIRANNSIIENQNDIEDFALQCFPISFVEREDAIINLKWNRLEYNIWYSIKGKDLLKYEPTEEQINNYILNERKLKYEHKR